MLMNRGLLAAGKWFAQRVLPFNFFMVEIDCLIAFTVLSQQVPIGTGRRLMSRIVLKFTHARLLHV